MVHVKKKKKSNKYGSPIKFTHIVILKLIVFEKYNDVCIFLVDT